VNIIPTKRIQNDVAFVPFHPRKINITHGAILVRLPNSGDAVELCVWPNRVSNPGQNSFKLVNKARGYGTNAVQAV
jgi:hypothetical protein